MKKIIGLLVIAGVIAAVAAPNGYFKSNSDGTIDVVATEAEVTTVTATTVNAADLTASDDVIASDDIIVGDDLTVTGDVSVVTGSINVMAGNISAQNGFVSADRLIGTSAFANIITYSMDSESLTNGATFTPTYLTTYISGVGGANDTTNTVTLGDAQDNTTVTILVDPATTNLIKIADSGTVYLAGDWIGDGGDTIVLSAMSGSIWFEISRSNN